MMYRDSGIGYATGLMTPLGSELRRSEIVKSVVSGGGNGGSRPRQLKD